MFKPTLMMSGIALMLGTTLAAAAEDAANAAELRQLKDRLAALEKDAPKPAPARDRGNAFNPKISLILDGGYVSYSSQAPSEVPGVLLAAETAGRAEGLAIGETEIALEANVDNQFRGWATVAIGAEGDIGIEEAYVNSLGLPAGFALKFGRFFSDIGYQNHQHAHAWEFADAPLVYRALLGNQLGDDGVQVRWVAPTDLLLEFGAEALRGDGFPGGGNDRSGANAYTGFAHLGGDAGSGGSWRIGLSHLNADADARGTGELPADTTFTGNSDLSIVDAVFKWAPDGNPALTHILLQAEYFARREQGSVVFDPAGAADTSAYDGDQDGWYVQGIYQFMPRWRMGLRYDRLSIDNALSNPAPGTSLALLADNSHDPQRYSAMMDFSNSEFSRLRLQYNQDQSRPSAEKDHQLIVQYILSLGAHPAHQF